MLGELDDCCECCCLFAAKAGELYEMRLPIERVLPSWRCGEPGADVGDMAKKFVALLGLGGWLPELDCGITNEGS